MDNRLKFRAYVKSLKWMVPVERINFDCQTIEVDLTDGNGDTAEYDFDEIELMQCTGLTAAKSYRGDSEEDRLVFEGDRVRVTYFDGCDETSEILTVTWDAAGCSFSPWNWGYICEGCDCYCEIGSIEIIGNIHEGEFKCNP